MPTAIARPTEPAIALMKSRRLIASPEAQDKASCRLKIAHWKVAGCEFKDRSLSARPMSALGHKRTSRHVSVMSALPQKADITRTSRNVRQVPKAEVGPAQYLVDQFGES
jgi:hypothetical protein